MGKLWTYLTDAKNRSSIGEKLQDDIGIWGDLDKVATGGSLSKSIEPARCRGQTSTNNLISLPLETLGDIISFIPMSTKTYVRLQMVCRTFKAAIDLIPKSMGLKVGTCINDACSIRFQPNPDKNVCWAYSSKCNSQGRNSLVLSQVSVDVTVTAVLTGDHQSLFVDCLRQLAIHQVFKSNAKLNGSKVNVICSYEEGRFDGNDYYQQLIPFAGALNPRSNMNPLTDFQFCRNAGPALRSLTLGKSNNIPLYEISSDGLTYLDRLRVLQFKKGWRFKMAEREWILPNLRIISFFTPVNVDTFLGIVQRCPRLQEFEAVCVDHGDQEFFEKCETACNNALGFNLMKRLYVSYQRMSLIELFKIAERLHRPFPNLECLTIDLSYISMNDFVSCFTVSADIMADIFVLLEEKSERLKSVDVSCHFLFDEIPGEMVTYFDRVAGPVKESFKNRRMKV
ncbi:hypothetical protein HDU76_002123 [Blyttiomyces sp. JEL0837]|nr:hypothetical protein HDU76_002123 [Blyttiomyces sp. JEL0837]